MLETERSLASPQGLLIANLGTPDSPKPEDVGRYLKQFLMDKWVIDIAYPLRWFLINVLIVPKRKFASGEAYEQIWGERGSPLLYHTKDLGDLVRARMPDWKVEIGMRYGNPSLESGLRRLKEQGCGEVLVMPLYPQYAESSTRTSQEECTRQAEKLGLKVKFVKPFYDHKLFIESFAAIVKSAMIRERPDHLLMSFHGLPERHIRRLDRTGGQHCFVQNDCCAKITDANRDCYRAQSFATARLIAEALKLSPDQWSVSFQSRLGRTPWIKPFTDEVIPELAKKGVKKLAVVCPSFVSDCLETIEEIGMRGRDLFLEAGGREFVAIPCLNSETSWADAVAIIARQNLGERA